MYGLWTLTLAVIAGLYITGNDGQESAIAPSRTKRGAKGYIAGMCKCYGDPHCISFDNNATTYMGTCTYLMAQDGCQNGVPFGFSATFRLLINTWNKNNGKQMSWVKEAELYFWNDTIPLLLSLRAGRVVSMDGVKINHFPADILNKTVQITKTKRKIVITTTSGIEFKWSNESMKVTVPPAMKNQMCGLCGNYNDDPSDDWIMGDANRVCFDPDITPGQLAPDHETFSESWLYKMDDDEFCSEACNKTKVNNNCTEKETTAARDECSFLKDPNGQFADCLKQASEIDINHLVSDCVFDACVAGDADICGKAEELVSLCAEAYNVTIENWRNETFCPLECPKDMHYESWGLVCRASCLDPSGNSCVGTTGRTEDCFCNDGLIQDGDECITEEKCGCEKNGVFYGVGDTMVSLDCLETCTCESPRSEMTCTQNKCDVNSECKTVDGVRKCVCQNGFDGNGETCTPTTALCRAQGDPHLHTFDGASYPFMGTCQYIMAQDGCENGTYSGSGATFRVIINNWNTNNGARVAWVKEVYVDLFTKDLLDKPKPPKRISLLKGDVVTVDGIPLPTSPALIEKVKVRQKPGICILNFPNGVEMRWNGHLMRVKIPATMKGQMCGLCGNYNGNEPDDYIMGDGNQICANSTLIAGNIAADGDELGRSWLYQMDSDQRCNMDCTGNSEPLCSDEATRIAVEQCAVLNNKTGIFKECLAVCDYEVVTQMVNDCVFDTCVAGDPDMVYPCTLAAELVSWCRQNYSVVIDDWRSDDFCPMHCPENMTYNSCGLVCQRTCLDRNADECAGKTECTEGCFCNPGLIEDGERCLEPDECGCFKGGINYAVGQTYVNEDCTESCVCESGKTTMTCVTFSPKCDENSWCAVVDGARECVCNPGYEGNGTVCTYKTKATCKCYGDPHCESYDGVDSLYLGSCSYLLTQDGCIDGRPGDVNLTFRIISNNWNRGKGTPLSWVKSADVHVWKDSVMKTISLLQDKVVQVDGEEIDLPDTPVEGVSVRKTRGRVIVYMEATGVEIKWDGNSKIKAIIPDTMKGQMCGLCGNYNDNMLDDWTMGDSNNLCPDPTIIPGQLTFNVDAFAKSWIWDDDDDQFCSEECNDTISSQMTCTEEEIAAATDHCSVLGDKSGVFGECLKVFNQEHIDKFMEACIFDTCMAGDKANEYPCEEAEDLLVMCREEVNITIPSWRSADFCPLDCPENSSYSNCGSECQGTCTDPTASNCVSTNDCDEGCFCDDGYVLNANDECTRKDQCPLEPK